MAQILFDIEVKGVGNPQLPVAVVTPLPIEVGDKEVRVRFQIINTFKRKIVITGLAVFMAGEAASKLNASLLNTTMVLIPSKKGPTVTENEIIITPLRTFMEGDSAILTVSGEEK